MSKHPNTPIPAAIDGAAWQVVDGPGYVSFGKSPEPPVMAVPVHSVDPVADLIRLHEMGHVAISPRGSRLTDLAIVQACEDLRVNRRVAERIGRYEPMMREAIRQAGRHIRSPDGAATVTALPIDQLVRHTLSHVVWSPTSGRRTAPFLKHLKGRLDRVAVDPHYKRAILQTVREAQDRLGANRPLRYGEQGPASFDEVKQYAYRLYDLLGRAGLLSGASVPAWIQEPETNEEKSFSELLARVVPEPPGIVSTETAPRWARLLIHKPTLDTTQRPSRGASGQRAAEEGVIPTRIHRHLVDGRLFSRRARRVTGGSYLFDQSGSMNATIHRIGEVVAELGGATIAVYSAANSAVGHLDIVASRYRMVSTLPRRGGGNEVDLPALQWLAKQPAPRYWVSDGLACTSRVCSETAVSTCHEFAKQNGIVRVNDSEALLECLRSGKRPDPGFVNPYTDHH